MLQPPLNDMQIHFLQSLRFVTTDAMFQELKQMISKYCLEKAQEETEKWWNENDMTAEKLDSMFADAHYRSSKK